VAGLISMNTNDLSTLTVEEVADALGVRPETVRLWAREGKIEAMRWGRRLRFRPDAIRVFQESRAVEVPDAGEFVQRAREKGRSR